MVISSIKIKTNFANNFVRTLKIDIYLRIRFSIACTAFSNNAKLTLSTKWLVKNESYSSIMCNIGTKTHSNFDKIPQRNVIVCVCNGDRYNV